MSIVCNKSATKFEDSRDHTQQNEDYLITNSKCKSKDKDDCNKTIKSVACKTNHSLNENLSTSRSTCRRNTNVAPFNLSCSNKRKKEDSTTDKEDYKFIFKARKIPKTHKVPFMVYYSTKSLTSFNNINQAKITSHICEKNKIIATTPYDQLHNDEEDTSNLNLKLSKIKSFCNQNQNEIKFSACNKKHDKENQQIAISKLNPQKLTNYELFEPLSENTNKKTIDDRQCFEILSDNKNFNKQVSDKNKHYLTESLKTPTNNQGKHIFEFELENSNNKKLELIAEKSEVTDEYNNGSQSKLDYLNESLLKTVSRVNNSFDSKDTVSLSEIDLDESMIDTNKIFGGNLDIDQIIRSQF